MTRTTKLAFFLLAATLGLAIGGAALLFLPIHRVLPASKTYGEAKIGGPFTLASDKGATITDRTFSGKWEVIYFGYTHCPDECPIALANLTVALKKLGPEASKMQALFVTVDPKRDTPKVMARYLKNFDPRILGLSGSQAQIDQIDKDYRVYVDPEKSNNGDLIVNHSIFFYVMDPHGRFATVIGGNATGAAIAAKLRKEFSHATS